MMGRGRGRGGRFGGRGGVPGGGGLTALDHLRDTAEEMGLDPRAASGSTQQEPLPSYPYIPIYPPRPLTEDEGIKIQAQRELVHWWQHSVYYLQPAARAATVTKEITRYSDRYRGTLENDGSRGPEAEKDGVKRSRRASLWEVIHVPEPKSDSAVYIPFELYPRAKSSIPRRREKALTKTGFRNRGKGAAATATMAKEPRCRVILEDEEEEAVGEGEEEEEVSGTKKWKRKLTQDELGEKDPVSGNNLRRKKRDEDDEDEEEEEEGLVEEEEEEEVDEDDDYAMNHYASDGYDGMDDGDEGGGDNEAIF